jgi:hypothetical protein
MKMLNVSTYHRAIVGCSAIVAATLVGFSQSASAQVQVNNSNAGGSNVTTNPSPIISTPSGISNFSSQAVPVLNNFNSAVSAQAALPPIPSTPTVVEPLPAQRFSLVGDQASCGCPNADTVGTKPTTESPELVAAKAAEAKAAADLAAAKAEAQQFIETVKNNTAAATVDRAIW